MLKWTSCVAAQGRSSVEKLIDPRLTDQSLVHAAAHLNNQRRASGLIASVFQKKKSNSPDA